MYSSEEFAELATSCRALTDRVAGELSPQVRERVAAAFLTSSRYELGFWQMAGGGRALARLTNA